MLPKSGLPDCGLISKKLRVFFEENSRSEAHHELIYLKSESVLQND